MAAGWFKRKERREEERKANIEYPETRSYVMNMCIQKECYRGKERQADQVYSWQTN